MIVYLGVIILYFVVVWFCGVDFVFEIFVVDEGFVVLGVYCLVEIYFYVCFDFCFWGSCYDGWGEVVEGVEFVVGVVEVLCGEVRGWGVEGEGREGGDVVGV